MRPVSRRTLRAGWQPALVVAALGCLLALRPSVDPPSALTTLLDADRAYGSPSTRPFMERAPELFARGVILQSASLVVGRDAVLSRLGQGRLGSGAKVTWAPIRGGIAADGTAGFTYGFMSIVRGDTTYPAKYLAFWVREQDRWRIQAFKIGPRPAGSATTTTALPGVLPGAGWTESPADSAASTRALADAERAFARAGATNLGDAFATYGDSLAGHMGESADFLFGREAIAADVRRAAGGVRITWAPDIVHVARSGDLGLSAGTIRVADDVTSPPTPFFTIWRRATPQAPWRFIAE